MTRQKYLTISFGLMALAIALGAIGAHALEKILEEKYLSTFDTGVRYLTIHSIGLLILSSTDKLKNLHWCRHFLFFGIIFFSGNCFLYSFLKIKTFAMLVPIGGFAFIIGWIVGIFELKKVK